MKSLVTSMSKIGNTLETVRERLEMIPLVIPAQNAPAFRQPELSVVREMLPLKTSEDVVRFNELLEIREHKRDYVSF